MEISLLVWLFIGAVLAFVAAVFVIGSLLKSVFRLRSKILSMSTRHGMMAEQLLQFPRISQETLRGSNSLAHQ